jgi:hypothetical protein
MAKILVVNRSSHDFSPAEEYGSLVYMTDGALERFNTSKMYRLFKPYIDASSPDDYILITGMTIMNVIACSMFSAKHDKLNILIFKDQKGGAGAYLEKTMVFH